MDDFAAYMSVFTYFKKKYHFSAAAGGGLYVFPVPAWVCFGSPAFENSATQVRLCSSDLRSDEDARSGAQQLLAAPSKQAVAATQGKYLFASVNNSSFLSFVAATDTDIIPSETSHPRRH